MADITIIDVNDVAGDLRLTFRLKGQRRFAARCWLAARLCTLAAWIVGTAVTVETSLDAARRDTSVPEDVQ